ncbi:Gfo/Idh/MocA family protein [Streptomyces sp. NPDC048282]|uniref:Gfo/Idh/MocA family protein n=1 Tax=Streptomyces sp. NPDC048282 TaxID=3365528 RepID=UPI003724C109
MTERTRAVAVVGFDHMHAGDFIRTILDHPTAEICGVWDTDPGRRDRVCDDLGVPAHVRFDDIDELAATRPDFAAVCSTTHEHGLWVEYFAARGIDVMVEKPFAVSLAEADRMISAAEKAGIRLAVNWPLAWYPVHRTTRRLIAEGRIGTVTEVHYYDGNRGPLHHLHDKKSVDGVRPEDKRGTWWYRAADGGGSLLDYLGYGATLATWFRDGELPTEVTTRTHVADGDEVDEQSVTIAAYAAGLSTFQTRWGTYTDPWTQQPYPRCGFVVVGTQGTIASFDYEDHVSVQTADRPAGERVPVDVLPLSEQNGVAHFIHALDTGTPLGGPISPAISRAGQCIVDAAMISATEHRTVEPGASL